MVDQPFGANKGTSHSDQGLAYEIWRDIGGGGYSVRKNFSGTGTNIRVYLLDNDTSVASSVAGSLSYSYLDSPATTSACSYRIYMGQWSARSNIECNPWENMTTWVLQEIAQ